MDRRRLPPDALQNNAASIGENFNLPGFVEDILQLKPDTTNLVCVIGASQVEGYWGAAGVRSSLGPLNRQRHSVFKLNPFAYAVIDVDERLVELGFSVVGEFLSSKCQVNFPMIGTRSIGVITQTADLS